MPGGLHTPAHTTSNPDMSLTTNRSSPRPSLRPSPRVAPPPVRPPLRLLGTEPWRAAGEFLQLQFSRAPRPHGDGHPVVIFPGLASDGRAVAPLRQHCRRLGHVALDWGRGFNTGPKGDVDHWLQALADDVQRLLRGHGQPPTLIGWSLGGLYARELAKLPGMPVRQVITIGTPFNGAPENTHVGWMYRLLNGQRAQLAPALRQRLRTPPPVPTTSI